MSWRIVDAALASARKQRMTDEESRISAPKAA